MTCLPLWMKKITRIAVGRHLSNLPPTVRTQLKTVTRQWNRLLWLDWRNENLEAPSRGSEKKSRARELQSWRVAWKTLRCQWNHNNARSECIIITEIRCRRWLASAWKGYTPCTVLAWKIRSYLSLFHWWITWQIKPYCCSFRRTTR